MTLDLTDGGSERDRVDAILMACVDGPAGAPIGPSDLESLVLGDRNLLVASIARMTFGNSLDLTMACSNPECGYNIRIDNGEISFGRSLSPSFK